MIPRVSEVFSQSGHRFREHDFTTVCARCHGDRNLSKCKTRVVAEVRTYHCCDCGDLLVVVEYPTDRPISGEECRVGMWWSVHPVHELIVQLQNSRLTIPAARASRVNAARR